MLVTPLPGTDRRHLATALTDIRIAVENLRGGAAAVGAGIERVYAYLQWAHDAARTLRGLVRPTDIEHLVLTRGYELLLAAYAHDPRVILGLLSLELDDRATALEEAGRDLRTVIERWSLPGQVVVADTSVFIHHPDQLDHLDVADLAGSHGIDTHLLIPMVVIDELDGLKQAGKDKVRIRARRTLAVIDRVFAHTTEPVVLHDPSTTPSDDRARTRLTVEVVSDPPGHIRLPINDDELIDRIVALEPLTARRIRLLTYDTGQSTRARSAGLITTKLHQLDHT